MMQRLKFGPDFDMLDLKICAAGRNESTGVCQSA